MELKLFGFKIPVVTVVISIILGMIISSFTLCSCVQLKQEGFDMGSNLNYNMGQGVPGDKWAVLPKNNVSTEKDMYASLEDNVGGTVPLPPDRLDFFFDTKFDPKCCYTPNQYSSSTGCACFSPAQMKYISSRGGNNTFAFQAQAAAEKGDSPF